jgi:hypothetical protein
MDEKAKTAKAMRANVGAHSLGVERIGPPWFEFKLPISMPCF